MLKITSECYLMTHVLNFKWSNDHFFWRNIAQFLTAVCKAFSMYHPSILCYIMLYIMLYVLSRSLPQTFLACKIISPSYLIFTESVSEYMKESTFYRHVWQSERQMVNLILFFYDIAILKSVGRIDRAKFFFFLFFNESRCKRCACTRLKIPRR